MLYDIIVTFSEIDVTAFKKLILSSAISDDVKSNKKTHCQVKYIKLVLEINGIIVYNFQNSSMSPLSVSKTTSRDKSKLDKKESEFLI